MPPSYLLCAFFVFLSSLLFKQSLADIVPQCGLYEEYRQCGPKCPISCKTLNTNVCCDVVCVSGCFCEDGYMLVTNFGNRKCVAINDCPKPGILEFRDLTIIVLESAKVAVITVQRLNGSYGEISVRWRTVEGTAKEQSDFIPSIGILNFPDGITVRTIQVSIVDDNIFEPYEFFTVELFDPTNKAQLSFGKQGRVKVIIKDDDARPGYIQFANNSITVPENFGTLIVTVLRVGGTDGLLSVQYRTVDGTAKAQQDYVPVNGVINFNNGDTRKGIGVTIINDAIREPLESFKLQLFDPTIASGIMNFKQPGSSLLTADIFIVDDDMNPGYIEFELIKITVLENVGVVNVVLVRLGGTDGLIRTKFRTVDGTARAGSDYVSANGEAVFEDGEPRKVIRLRIIDDNIREPTESFQLQIFDLTPGPDVINFKPLGSKMSTTIIITDNDMNPGYIEFELIKITVFENVGVVNVVLVRLGGTDGIIRTKFRTVDGTARAGSDYVLSNGEVTFEDGETQKFISLRIIDDTMREPTESFQLQIFDPTTGPDVSNFKSLGSKMSATIIIIDNDMTPGYLEFELIRITVWENIGILNVTLVRIGGTDGLISTRFQTVDGTARAGSDYVPANGEVAFRNGESRKVIPIRIIDDNFREPTESFQLQIFDVTPGPDVINYRSLGSQMATTIFILDNDMRRGFIEFTNPIITVPESIRAVTINVVRTNGKDGEIVVRYQTVDGSATSPSDYEFNTGQLVFKDGETLKAVTIRIMDDNMEEPTESFRLELFEESTGPDQNLRSLGQLSSVTVSIIDDDALLSTTSIQPPEYQEPDVSQGIEISFRQQIIRVREDAGEVRIPISRTGGLGAFTVQIITEDLSASGGMDYRRTRGPVSFQEGDIEVTIAIRIINDDMPELDETFLVRLFDASIGTISGSMNVVTVVIEDDDGGFQGRSGGSVRNPAPSPKPGPLIKCPDNLILKVCADTCPPSCDSLFGKVPCSANGCIKGCFCPDGLVKLNGLSDECIRPSQCSVKFQQRSGGSVRNPAPPAPPPPPPPKPGPVIKCPDNLILKVCADTCPPSCDSLSGNVPCSANGCIKACFCPDGFVKLNGLSDQCIRPSQCPGRGGGGGCPTKRCSSTGQSLKLPQSSGLLGLGLLGL